MLTLLDVHKKAAAVNFLTKNRWYFITSFLLTCNTSSSFGESPFPKFKIQAKNNHSFSFNLERASQKTSLRSASRPRAIWNYYRYFASIERTKTSSKSGSKVKIKMPLPEQELEKATEASAGGHLGRVGHCHVCGGSRVISTRWTSVKQSRTISVLSPAGGRPRQHASSGTGKLLLFPCRRTHLTFGE